MIIAIQDEGARLDPHLVTDAGSMRLIENMYSTLLRYGATYGEVEPDLALRLDQSEDGLTYRITLRENAFFHSGRPVTSMDVRYSLDRIRTLGVRADLFAATDHIVRTDAQPMVVQVARRFAPLETYLAHPMNAIVDREVVEAHKGRLDDVDAGSGPFQLASWKRGQHLRLSRFGTYHLHDRPYLNEVEFRPMPDETARSTMLQTGEIDLMLSIPAKDLSLIRDTRHVVVESVPGTFWEYLGINVTRPPFDDVRVRQAVAWAIDRDLINQLVKFGRAQVLDGGHLPDNHWASLNESMYPHRDVQRAKSLLAEAGFENGFETTLKIGSNFSYQVRAAEVVKQNLRDVGIRVTLKAMESTVFFAALGRQDFDMVLVGWVGFVDPDEWTWNLFHSQGKYNQQSYRNPTLDALLDEARTTLERKRRKALYAKIQQIVAMDCPMVFLYANEQISAYRDRVHGFTVHPTATTISLRDTWVSASD